MIFERIDLRTIFGQLKFWPRIGSFTFIQCFCLVLMVERGSVSSVSNMQRAGDVTNYQSMDQTSSPVQTEIFDRIWSQQV